MQCNSCPYPGGGLGLRDRHTQFEDTEKMTMWRQRQRSGILCCKLRNAWGNQKLEEARKDASLEASGIGSMALPTS